MVLLIGSLQNPVERRFRGEILAPIRQPRHDLAGRQVGKLRPVARRQDALAFRLAQRVRGLRPHRLWAPIGTNLPFAGPALEGSRRDADNPAGWRQARAGLAGLINQLDGFTAIRGADHSSSPSPQIARAFFDRVNNAAVSASAFSLRLSSF